MIARPTKFLFLDFDGVIITQRCYHEPLKVKGQPAESDPECIAAQPRTAAGLRRGRAGDRAQVPPGYFAGGEIQTMAKAITEAPKVEDWSM